MYDPSLTRAILSALERINVFKTFVYFRTVTVYVNFYLLFANCRPNCTVVASRQTKAPICSFKVNFRVLMLKLYVV